jgi:hypothetical protein
MAYDFIGFAIGILIGIYILAALAGCLPPRPY